MFRLFTILFVNIVGFVFMSAAVTILGMEYDGLGTILLMIAFFANGFVFTSLALRLVDGR